MSNKDYYMQIKIAGSEVKGESADDAHPEWIELDSISHSITQPSSGSSSSGGAKPEGRCQHGEFIFTKALDASSAKLYLALCKGDMVDELIVELCRSTGEKTCYMKYTFKNGFISSFSTSAAGDIPFETYGVSYTNVEWEYAQLNPDDFKVKTKISHKWNCDKNTGE